MAKDKRPDFRAPRMLTGDDIIPDADFRAPRMLTGDDITEVSKGFDATKQRAQAMELELARLNQRKRAALSAMSDERSGPRRDELRSLYNKLDLEHEKQKVRLKELKGIHGPHRTYHEKRDMRRARHEEARRADALRRRAERAADRARRLAYDRAYDEARELALRAGVGGGQGVPTQALRAGARFGGGALSAAALDLMGREEHTPQEYYREQGRGIAEMTGLNPAYGEDPATDPREVAAILMALEAAQRAGVPYEERFPEGIRVAPGEAAMTPAQVENVRAMQRQRR